MNERIEMALKKSVKERTEIDHRLLIKEKYNGSVRDYLLSMGDFKDVDSLIKDTEKKPFRIPAKNGF